MNEQEYSNRIQSMIQTNQPYYAIFDVMIEYMLIHKIPMRSYELHRNVCVYIKPYASPELLNYFEKNIDHL
jgi:hypothetical protein